jgi:NADPH-dependent curcumin reductase CurA
MEVISKIINQKWCVAKHADSGYLTPEHFSWVQEELPTLQDGEFLVRTVYLSLDPTNRIWMMSSDSYLPALKIGDTMRGGGIGIVEESKNPHFKKGTYVQGLVNWQKYIVAHSHSGFSPLEKNPNLPLTAYLGLFGMIGLTSYFGLMDIGKPKANETVLVSTAAGAVGSLVVQIAKAKGCKVVGLTGSDEKCAWLEELGITAINYKKPNLAQKLAEACPNGVDVYFDNVGGEILELALDLMNLGGRIVACGAISQYNNDTPSVAPRNLFLMVSKRLTMQGFIVIDYFPRAAEAYQELGQLLMQGKLQYKVDIVTGLENAVSAVNKLYDGSNQGKLVVKVSEE